MMKETVFNGKVWVIADSKRQLISDIDTDQIFHNAHLHITDINEMGKYTFGNLKGWEDFPSKVQPGDMVIVGSNFGSGSSRQQAVDCFRALGVTLIIAASYGAIYKRNAINSGFIILTMDRIEDVVNSGKIKNQDQLEIDFSTGKLVNKRSGEHFDLEDISTVQLDIYKKGTLLDI
jgi:3-isopropylmalate/(R)-2-methylmalate dehydratase small subunit